MTLTMELETRLESLDNTSHSMSLKSSWAANLGEYGPRERSKCNYLFEYEKLFRIVDQ